MVFVLFFPPLHCIEEQKKKLLFSIKIKATAEKEFVTCRTNLPQNMLIKRIKFVLWYRYSLQGAKLNWSPVECILHLLTWIINERVFFFLFFFAKFPLPPLPLTNQPWWRPWADNFVFQTRAVTAFINLWMADWDTPSDPRQEPHYKGSADLSRVSHLSWRNWAEGSPNELNRVLCTPYE